MIIVSTTTWKSEMVSFFHVFAITCLRVLHISMVWIGELVSADNVIFKETHRVLTLLGPSVGTRCRRTSSRRRTASGSSLSRTALSKRPDSLPASWKSKTKIMPHLFNHRLIFYGVVLFWNSAISFQERYKMCFSKLLNPLMWMSRYDECHSPDHGCEHECINTLGGYSCSCR